MIIYNSNVIIDFMGEIVFTLALIHDKCLKFVLKIPLTNEHLFYKYFVCSSVSFAFRKI